MGDDLYVSLLVNLLHPEPIKGKRVMNRVRAFFDFAAQKLGLTRKNANFGGGTAVAEVEHVDAPAVMFMGGACFTDENGKRYGCGQNGGKLGYIEAESVEKLPGWEPAAGESNLWQEIKFRDGAWRRVVDNCQVMEADVIVVKGKQTFAKNAF